MGLSELLDLCRQFLHMPTVRIRLSADREGREAFDYFTRAHPRYRIIQHKSWGVALLRLPDDFASYLAGPERRKVRRHRSRALRAGYRFGEFEPLERLDQILAINGSAEFRQGKPIRADYLNPGALADFLRLVPRMYGLFNPAGEVRAYAYTPVCGEVFTFSRLLGHAEDLPAGVMDLLVSEVIRCMTEQKQAEGRPLWAMYDTFFGAAPGLREFKEHLGFKPYRAIWLWEGSRHGDR